MQDPEGEPQTPAPEIPDEAPVVVGDDSQTPAPELPDEAPVVVGDASQVPVEEPWDWRVLLESGPLQALAIVAAAIVGARLLNALVVRSVRLWAKRTKTTLDERMLVLLRGPLVKSVVLLGLAIAATRMDLDPALARFTRSTLWTIALILWLIFAFRASGLLIRAASKVPDRFRAVEERTLPLFDNLAKIALVALGVYLLIVAWDFEVTGLLASAGILGIALGFAAQETLANLFAGVLIIADAPYRVGDYVNLVSGDRGRVVHIGLRSTRLLTRDDVEVTVPNAVIAGGRIINESAGPSPKHRIRVQVGVAYGSDIDRVRAILVGVAKADKDVCEEPEPRVRFRTFGDSGLNLELLCWIPEPWMRGRMLDTLNTEVYKRFQAEGVEIPFPKRDVYVRAVPDGASPTLS